MSEKTTENSDQSVRDPALQNCTCCGAANDNHTEPEGFAHHCHNCGAFVRQATAHESWLLAKRIEQAILHEQGQVTVCGYTPGIDGPAYDSPAATTNSPGGGVGV